MWVNFSEPFVLRLCKIVVENKDFCIDHDVKWTVCFKTQCFEHVFYSVFTVDPGGGY